MGSLSATWPVFISFQFYSFIQKASCLSFAIASALKQNKQAKTLEDPAFGGLPFLSWLLRSGSSSVLMGLAQVLSSPLCW